MASLLHGVPLVEILDQTVECLISVGNVNYVRAVNGLGLSVEFIGQSPRRHDVQGSK